MEHNSAQADPHSNVQNEKVPPLSLWTIIHSYDRPPIPGVGFQSQKGNARDVCTLKKQKMKLKLCVYPLILLKAVKYTTSCSYCFNLYI